MHQKIAVESSYKLLEFFTSWMGPTENCFKLHYYSCLSKKPFFKRGFSLIGFLVWVNFYLSFLHPKSARRPWFGSSHKEKWWTKAGRDKRGFGSSQSFMRDESRMAQWKWLLSRSLHRLRSRNPSWTIRVDCNQNLLLIKRKPNLPLNRNQTWIELSEPFDKAKSYSSLSLSNTTNKRHSRWLRLFIESTTSPKQSLMLMSSVITRMTQSNA